MNSKHLTDEILQAYVLKEIQDDIITNHLAVCSKCKKSFEEYKFLIGSISEVKPEAFPFDITTLAINSITLYEKKQSKKQELVFWGLLIFLSIAILSFSIPYLPTILDLFYSNSTFTMLLVIGTSLIIFLFLLADLALHYKTKENKLFKNNLQPTI